MHKNKQKRRIIGTMKKINEQYTYFFKIVLVILEVLWYNLRKTNRPLPEHIKASKHSDKTSLKGKTLGKSMVIELKPEFREQVKPVEGAKLVPLYPQQKK